MEENHSLFTLLVLSLGNAALIGLGMIEDPETQLKTKNLPVAKHNIDMLEELRVKTKNNLNHEEDAILDGLLYDLRIQFLDAQKE